MAIYDYQCPKCQNIHEEWHLMSANPVIACTKCKHSPCTKLIGGSSSVHVAKREIWQYNDIHKVRPKWLKSRDGKVRVRYDPTKHGDISSSA